MDTTEINKLINSRENVKKIIDVIKRYIVYNILINNLYRL
jgi:hypothetical protein